MSSVIVKNGSLSVLIGAAFLMATSSVGPGFMTQTAKFTEDFGPSFGFIILISIIISFVAQINIWRIITMSKLRGQDIANKVFPGLGYVISILVAAGGFAFNIGNIGGAAIGIKAMTNIDITTSSALAGIFGILLFSFPRAKNAMDNLAKIFGALMIILIAYVAIITQPPVVEAMKQTIVPDKISVIAIITLAGGTVGGYITFAGGHRLIDAGICGTKHLKDVNLAATLGIVVDLAVRVLLFLAVLGVVSKGLMLDPKDPAGSAFRHASGNIGYLIFGAVFFMAAITSVVGAAYTSVSFLKTLFKFVEKYERFTIIAFIVASTLMLIFIGKPAKMLVLVGALNGLILPITLGAMLFAVDKKEIMNEYVHPKYLTVLGWIVVAITAYLGIISLSSLNKLWM